MNAKHRKTLADIFANPVNGGLEWARIEALLIALGCTVRQTGGSGVAFCKDGHILHAHRPHPGRAALRYRVMDVREFIETLGMKP